MAVTCHKVNAGRAGPGSKQPRGKGELRLCNLDPAAANPSFLIIIITRPYVIEGYRIRTYALLAEAWLSQPEVKRLWRVVIAMRRV